MLNSESSLTKETEHQIRTPPRARKAPVQSLTDLRDIEGEGGFKMALTIPTAELFRVHFRGIRRQFFHHNFGMSRRVVLDPLGAMRPRTIPNHNEGTRELAAAVFHPLDHNSARVDVVRQ